MSTLPALEFTAPLIAPASPYGLDADANQFIAIAERNVVVGYEALIGAAEIS